MTWVTTAGEIQAACKAGLQLVGVYEGGSPEYLGSQEQWEVYTKLINENV